MSEHHWLGLIAAVLFVYLLLDSTDGDRIDDEPPNAR